MRLLLPKTVFFSATGRFLEHESYKWSKTHHLHCYKISVRALAMPDFPYGGFWIVNLEIKIDFSGLHLTQIFSHNAEMRIAT